MRLRRQTLQKNVNTEFTSITISDSLAFLDCSLDKAFDRLLLSEKTRISKIQQKCTHSEKEEIITDLDEKISACSSCLEKVYSDSPLNLIRESVVSRDKNEKFNKKLFQESTKKGGFFRLKAGLIMFNTFLSRYLSLQAIGRLSEF